MQSDMYYDAVIAGCGVAGLYTALNLPDTMRILMVCKGDMEECDSMLAQGGICVLHDENDYDSYFEDTMRAGHYENRKESVDLMIRCFGWVSALNKMRMEVCDMPVREDIPVRESAFIRILLEKK